LRVSHTGSLAFHSPTHTFHITGTLCVPSIHKNLIFVHHFTLRNNVFIEFHPFFFLVKDQITAAVLFKGVCENGVYTLPDSLVSSPKMVTNVHERTSLDRWHKRLGHPSQKLVNQIIKSFSLPIKHKDHVSYLCTSCSINKAHKQPFCPTTLVSHAPLDLIYTNVWGPSDTVGLDGSCFYLILVDHFTKYILFYPMSNKSCVSRIFPQFKHLVEKQFHTTIKSIYSDDGGEFVALKQYISIDGISHYTTAPHTPQQNGVSERRHRHLVETGLTLLHDASLPLSYWPHVFSTAAYLINRQPTPLLQNKTPFEILFCQPPNYLKLKRFGCRCFPLIKPYNTNKLQPKATTCLFLGYFTTQNAYKCLDLSTNKLYLSRHVLFDESHSPFQALTPASSSSTPSSSATVPLIGVPALLQPSPVILDRAAISTSPSGTVSALSFSVEEQLPFNSPCYSPTVVHHSENITSLPVLPLTSASPSPLTIDVAIPVHLSATVIDVVPNPQPQRTHSMITM